MSNSVIMVTRDMFIFGNIVFYMYRDSVCW